MKKILLTGGGTAGHVTPNIALIPYLKDAGLEIEYMGSYVGIEKTLIEEQGIPYTGISSGKLRRYIDLKNLTDPARIVKGLHEAKNYLRSHKPDLIFSKGGFVTVPVILAAAQCHIPVIIHESDMTPGLANKLSMPKATKICYSFPESKEYFPADKHCIQTGLPVRRELLNGSREKGLSFCGFDGSKPLLMIIGGSLGSLNINNAVRSALSDLLVQFDIAHICGAGKTDDSLNTVKGYRQFEYVNAELPDLMAAADLIISRAGANVIHEISAICKPSLLIPLGLDQSRGDQIMNAESFRKRGFAEVLTEDKMNASSLTASVQAVFDKRQSYIDTMKAADTKDAAAAITDIILSLL